MLFQLIALLALVAVLVIIRKVKDRPIFMKDLGLDWAQYSAGIQPMIAFVRKEADKLPPKFSRGDVVEVVRSGPLRRGLQGIIHGKDSCSERYVFQPLQGGTVRFISPEYTFKKIGHVGEEELKAMESADAQR